MKVVRRNTHFAYGSKPELDGHIPPLAPDGLLMLAAAHQDPLFTTTDSNASLHLDPPCPSVICFPV
jgi:hypothetical protein